jgi:16S rRNA (guanine527-N7)-methyltransferase
MDGGCADQQAALDAAASRMGIHLNEGQHAQFVRYCQVLLAANQQTNLTGVRTPEGITERLFLDALALYAVLPPEFRARPVKVVDVGSGAGLPGIPLKVVCPHWSLTLVESTGKKAGFLAEVVEALALTDVTVLNQRAEVVGADRTRREAADLCLARAVAPLPSLLELCAPLVRVSGWLVFPKGGKAREEVRAAEFAAERLGLQFDRSVSTASLHPSLDGFAVIYRKVRATPTGYPRRVGLARSRPIGTGG